MLTSAEIGSENVVNNEKLKQYDNTFTSTTPRSILRSALEIYLPCYFQGKKYRAQYYGKGGDGTRECIISCEELTDLRDRIVLNDNVKDLYSKNEEFPLLKVFLRYYQKKINWEKYPKCKEMLIKIFGYLEKKIV